MLILRKGERNELVLNINNNSRLTFLTYSLKLTHILSQETKTYIIDTTDNGVYGANDRYCEIILQLDNDDLNYEGQYYLEIYGDGTSLVFTGMARLEGSKENNEIIHFTSDNEDNSNFIYIKE